MHLSNDAWYVARHPLHLDRIGALVEGILDLPDSGFADEPLRISPTDGPGKTPLRNIRIKDNKGSIVHEWFTLGS
ncbi:MAG: hypothetical protein WED15_01850 [Akkermansiaceae bacterium]